MDQGKSALQTLATHHSVSIYRYPIEGYLPLQDPPHLMLQQAAFLVECIKRLVFYTAPEKMDQAKVLSIDTVKLIVIYHLLEQLAPLLHNSYTIAEVWLPFLLKISSVPKQENEPAQLKKFLEIIWSCLEDNDLKVSLELTFEQLCSSYAASPVTADFHQQIAYLELALSLLKHPQTRKLLLLLTPFKEKFVLLMHVRQPQDLSGVLSQVWWEDCPIPDHPDVSKEKFGLLCKQLQKNLFSISSLQVEVLKQLLQEDGKGSERSSRSLFLPNLRNLIVMVTSSAYRGVVARPQVIMTSLFFSLYKATKFYWGRHMMAQSAEKAIRFSDACINNGNVFLNIDGEENRGYRNLPRIGGSVADVKKWIETGAPVDLMGKLQMLIGDSGSSNLQRLFAASQQQYASMKNKPGVAAAAISSTSDTTKQCEDESLLYLLDCLMMLYSAAVHRVLREQCCTSVAILNQFSTALSDMLSKTGKCSPQDSEVNDVLMKTREVFTKQCFNCTRNVGWLASSLFTEDNLEAVVWTLSCTLRTLLFQSAKGTYLSAVPECYIRTVSGAYNAACLFFKPASMFSSLPDYHFVLEQMASFLCTHCNDPRIINPDLQESFIESLVGFVCHKESLLALEKLPLENRKILLLTIMDTFSKNSWISSAGLLARFWKGDGFASNTSDLVLDWLSSDPELYLVAARLKNRCPSHVFQEHLAEICITESASSIQFINGLLNQLNLVFSEVMSLVQTLHSAENGPSPKQLRTCTTCYNITVSLLRTLEMLATRAPEVFLDPNHPNSKITLDRLVELLIQVLNRMSAGSALFDKPVLNRLAGTDKIEKTSILFAVSGILLEVCKQPPAKENFADASQVIVSYPGFKLSSFEQLLAVARAHYKLCQGTLPRGRWMAKISHEEVKKLERFIARIKEASNSKDFTSATSQDSGEDTCSICCAYPLSVQFVPCKHQSCRDCITRHLLNNNKCFFCQAPIQDVKELTK
ncbi:E3 ubiquitin-protein ligase RNF123-like isoform X2 [Dysidea avara]|uniref:E3 ubiquitin-protein ligase RNF123-like isoform X2 n=1 Tax=Dysidea avara TaxID=196820 RepID=UPI003322C380